MTENTAAALTNPTPRVQDLYREMAVEIDTARSWVGIDDEFAREMMSSAAGTAHMLVIDGYLGEWPTELGMTMSEFRSSLGL